MCLGGTDDHLLVVDRDVDDAGSSVVACHVGDGLHDVVRRVFRAPGVLESVTGCEAVVEGARADRLGEVEDDRVIQRVDAVEVLHRCYVGADVGHCIPLKVSTAMDGLTGSNYSVQRVVLYIKTKNRQFVNDFIAKAYRLRARVLQ